MKRYNVTGTKHGSIIIAKNEGEARKLFHEKYNGESILSSKDTSSKNYWKKIIKNQQELE